MNTALKFSAAGALVLAGVAAHASFAQPSSGSSDAILFAEVVNAAGTAAVASFAGDTGVSISTIAAGLTGTTTYLGGDANLAKLFAADAPGDTIWFGVMGGQFTGTANLANFKTPGAAQFVTTTYQNNTNQLSLDTTSTLYGHFATFDKNVGAINSNFQASTTPSAKSIEGASPATSGLWDVTATLGAAYWNGGATPTGNITTLNPAVSENLFYVTAGGGTTPTANVSYTIEGTATLTAGGLILTGTNPGGGGNTVPLPAAFWLLGSGLLGLTGVARRKLKV